MLYLICRRRSYPLKSDSDRPIRFAVRSLGWVEIAEEDLTPERSSKAVNKCIVDLSLGRNDLLDVVGRWGDVSTSYKSFRNEFTKVYHLFKKKLLLFSRTIPRVKTYLWT